MFLLYHLLIDRDHRTTRPAPFLKRIDAWHATRYPSKKNRPRASRRGSHMMRKHQVATLETCWRGQNRGGTNINAVTVLQLQNVRDFHDHCTDK